MANDLMVSAPTFTPSVTSVSPALKVRQDNADSPDASAASAQAAGLSTFGIQTSSELQKAVLAGDPITLGDAQMIKTIERANKALEGGSTTFKFAIHKDTNLISIKVIDKDTGKVIREIPSDKTLDMVKKMWEMAGLLVDERR